MSMPEARITLRKEKYTPNTVRFVEVASEEEPRNIPFLYVTKWLFEKLERPELLTVTVEPEKQ